MAYATKIRIWPNSRADFFPAPPGQTGGHAQGPPAESAGQGRAGAPHKARCSPDTVAGSKPRRGAAPGRATARQPSGSAGQARHSVSSTGGQSHDDRDSESHFAAVRGNPRSHKGRRQRVQPWRRRRPKAAQSQSQPKARWVWMRRMMTAALAHRQSPSDGR